MKTKKIYYRKKGKALIIEGVINGQNTHILQLPQNPEKLLVNLGVPNYLNKSSKSIPLITKEKADKIRRQLDSLDSNKQFK